MATKKDEPAEVATFDVAGSTRDVVVTINGEAFRFDAQQFLALRQASDGVAINLNY